MPVFFKRVASYRLLDSCRWSYSMHLHGLNRSCRKIYENRKRNWEFLGKRADVVLGIGNNIYCINTQNSQYIN